MVDFTDYSADRTKVSRFNETSGWNKQIKKPVIRGGYYHFKCHCDLCNGLQDDCSNPNCHSSKAKLTKRTCSCGRSYDIKTLENEESKAEKKINENGGGIGSGDKNLKVKEPKNEIDTKVKDSTDKTDTLTKENLKKLNANGNKESSETKEKELNEFSKRERTETELKKFKGKEELKMLVKKKSKK